jgi:lysophospholipase L1-like esterase
MPKSPFRAPCILAATALALAAHLCAEPAPPAAISAPLDCGALVPNADGPRNPLLRYQGRLDSSDAARYRFDWSATTIEARFTGSRIGVILAGDGYFDAWIDGVKVPTLPGPDGILPATTHASFKLAPDGKTGPTTPAAPARLCLSANLPELIAGFHTLKLRKRSETHWSLTSFGGLLLEPGATLLPLPSRSRRRLEIIGDSYSAGYGNESPSKSDPTGQDASGHSCSNEELPGYTNAGLAFGPLAAEQLGAEVQVNAYSGLGMVRHYAGSTAFLPFPSYYARTLQSLPDSPPDLADWKPQVVVLELGTNDFSTPLGPNDAGRFASRSALKQAYRKTYREFLATLRARYPGVLIIAAATDTWPDDEMTAEVRAIVEAEQAAGRKDIRYFEIIKFWSNGCDMHPDLATHRKWAGALIKLLHKELGW